MTEYSLYSLVIVVYFLLSFYFMYVKFRHNRKQYQWLFISLLFLALGISRIFFQIHYFYVPTLEGTMSDLALIQTFLWFYILATLFTWIGITNLMGWVGILAFRYNGDFFLNRRKKKALKEQLLLKGAEALEKEKSSEDLDRKKEEAKLIETKILSDLKKKKPLDLKKVDLEQGKDMFVIALRLLIIIGILVVVLPVLIGPIFNDKNMTQLLDPALLKVYSVDLQFENAIVIGAWRYPVGRFLLNFVLLPICIAIIPFYFLYLAKKNMGIKRKSYLFNFIGFILYMAGRIAQGIFNAIGSYALEATLPPLLILVSLIALYWANHYPEL